MPVLTSMTIIELATGIVAICGAIGAVIHNSRCSKINCCYLVKCDRDVKREKEETTGDDDFSRADNLQRAVKLENKNEDKV